MKKQTQKFKTNHHPNGKTNPGQRDRDQHWSICELHAPTQWRSSTRGDTDSRWWDRTSGDRSGGVKKDAERESWRNWFGTMRLRLSWRSSTFGKQLTRSLIYKPISSPSPPSDPPTDLVAIRSTRRSRHCQSNFWENGKERILISIWFWGWIWYWYCCVCRRRWWWICH